MSDDQAKLFSSLRASTVALLGYDAADQLSAAQQIRVDRAVMLRLLIDDLTTKQMRGEPIDVRAFVAASEDLERMVGGNPASPPAEARFGNDARKRLRELIERTVLAPSIEDPDEIERMRDIHAREELAAIVAAAPEPAAPLDLPAALRSAPAPVASPPAQQKTSSQPPLPRDGEIPAHYLRQPREPWRPYVIPSDGGLLGGGDR
jgi:hypothetical protein